MNYLNPKKNDQANRLHLTKTFLWLWLIFAVAAMVMSYIHDDNLRVTEEFIRLFCPPLIFLYFISKSNNPRWIPWPFYYASFHLFTNVLLRVDTFALDIFMVIPLVLSGYIAMKRSHAIWYSGFSAIMALSSFVMMEFYHKSPFALQVEHQSKNVYLIMITIVLCTGLLNHFKSLFDINIQRLEESLKSVNAYNRDNQLLINLITHDINNHLNRLLMSVEFLENLHENPKKYKKYHEQAVNGVMDIRDIINNFKMLRGHGEEGELEIKTKEVLVESVLQKLELIFEESLLAKQLNIVKMIHKDVDTVAVEPISFSHHLMANIMGNAIKFSQDEAELEFKVYNVKNRVYFEITNTASKEHLSNLVQAKAKKKIVSRKGTHNEQGQGLGMKLVDQVGQLSGVDWQLNWKVCDDNNTLRVTNIVTVPRKISIKKNPQKEAA